MDNATIAGMVIKRLLESLDQGKTVCVAFPLAVAAFVGEPDHRSGACGKWAALTRRRKSGCGRLLVNHLMSCNRA